jgi:hypothetical protein
VLLWPLSSLLASDLQLVHMSAMPMWPEITLTCHLCTQQYRTQIQRTATDHLHVHQPACQRTPALVQPGAGTCWIPRCTHALQTSHRTPALAPPPCFSCISALWLVAYKTLLRSSLRPSILRLRPPHTSRSHPPHDHPIPVQLVPHPLPSPRTLWLPKSQSTSPRHLGKPGLEPAEDAC